MGKILDEDLIYEILSVVEEIPAGKVASYGQIARLIGWDKNSRLVGKVLSMAEFYGKYPCHRVVNHAGRTAPGWREQRELLEDEGVEFKANGCVDMKRHQWDDADSGAYRGSEAESRKKRFGAICSMDLFCRLSAMCKK